MEIIIGFTVLLLCLIGFIGYARNFYLITTADQVTGLTIIRVIGVFIPLVGAVYGFKNNPPTKTEQMQHYLDIAEKTPSYQTFYTKGGNA